MSWFRRKITDTYAQRLCADRGARELGHLIGAALAYGIAEFGQEEMEAIVKGLLAKARTMVELRRDATTIARDAD